MKIISLQAENIKKLKAVEIKPTGEIVTIAGKNGQGKTSILDSIWWALAGTSNIQGQPIRKGATKARIRLDLGELIVERKFTEGNSTLSVESTEGARFPSPQKMLDALIGELSFDPLAFARMEPRKQFDELRRVSKLDIDIDELNRLNASDYAKRTDVNRDAKAKRAQAEGVTVPEEVKGAEVDESALVDELQQAGETNTEIETRKARREQARIEADNLKQKSITSRLYATKLREDADAEFQRAGVAADAAYQKEKAAAADALKRALEKADTEDKEAGMALEKSSAIEKKIDEAAPLPASVDVTALRERITAAKQTNAAIAAHKLATERKAALIVEAAALEKQSHEITERMQARETAKAEGIKSATMPVAGLGFADGGVTFNDVPFDQASSAEQLRVSMAIAMSANPRLRVIRITDGSLLDSDSMAAIGAMAKDSDYQIWVERVDSSGKVGIVIDDGAVVAVNEESPA